MTSSARFVAVALLTDNEVQLVGGTLRKVYPITDDNDFTELLKAVDAAESGRNRDRA